MNITLFHPTHGIGRGRGMVVPDNPPLGLNSKKLWAKSWDSSYDKRPNWVSEQFLKAHLKLQATVQLFRRGSLGQWLMWPIQKWWPTWPVTHNLWPTDLFPSLSERGVCEIARVKPDAIALHRITTSAHKAAERCERPQWFHESDKKKYRRHNNRSRVTYV